MEYKCILIPASCLVWKSAIWYCRDLTLSSSCSSTWRRSSPAGGSGQFYILYSFIRSHFPPCPISLSELSSWLVAYCQSCQADGAEWGAGGAGGAGGECGGGGGGLPAHQAAGRLPARRSHPQIQAQDFQPGVVNSFAKNSVVYLTALSQTPRCHWHRGESSSPASLTARRFITIRSQSYFLSPTSNSF